jgi:hypothetical protein
MGLFETLGKTLKPETIATKEFRVVAVSSNTNSFGLRQMIMVAKDGTVFKGCFNYLNEKKRGEFIEATIILNDAGETISTSFIGGELVEQLPDAPDDVINNLWRE